MVCGHGQDCHEFRIAMLKPVVKPIPCQSSIHGGAKAAGTLVICKSTPNKQHSNATSALQQLCLASNNTIGAA